MLICVRRSNVITFMPIVRVRHHRARMSSHVSACAVHLCHNAISSAVRLFFELRDWQATVRESSPDGHIHPLNAEAYLRLAVWHIGAVFFCTNTVEQRGTLRRTSYLRGLLHSELSAGAVRPRDKQGNHFSW